MTVDELLQLIQRSNICPGAEIKIERTCDRTDDTVERPVLDVIANISALNGGHDSLTIVESD